MKKKMLLIPLVLVLGLMAGCRTNYYDYAFGARNRHEAQFPQPGINKDTDIPSARRQ
jgi:hypothetical protein